MYLARAQDYSEGGRHGGKRSRGWRSCPPLRYSRPPSSRWLTASSPFPLNRPSPPLLFISRLASSAGGTRPSAVFWVLHSVVITAIVLSRPLTSLRIFDVLIAVNPLVLACSCRSMALARTALPQLHARVARVGGDAAALFAMHLPGRWLTRLVAWSHPALLWLPASAATLSAFAMLVDPSLRDSQTGGATFLREVLAIALAVRALAAPLLVLFGLVRLLRFSLVEFWGRALPGAEAARAGVWLMSRLHASPPQGGGAPLSPDGARRELFGKANSGGLLHDAGVVNEAAAPALAALAAATALLVAMNGASALTSTSSGDAFDFVLHALLLLLGGLGGVGLLLLLANAWLDPLRRWLRRLPPLDLLRNVRGAGAWGAGLEAAEGGAAGVSGSGSAIALEMEAASLHEYYWTFLSRNGPLLQITLLGFPVDQKFLIRAFSAWLFGGAVSLLLALMPRTVVGAF